MPKKCQNFEENIFINCSFAKDFTALFHAIVFAVHDLQFRPRCALEECNAQSFRMDRLYKIISECKFSIHDISNTKLDSKTKLPRFNMPFELGLDFGCQYYGTRHLQKKNSLILDTSEHRYDIFLSDLSGTEVKGHHNTKKECITIIRNWLSPIMLSQGKNAPDGTFIYRRYRSFTKTLPILCANLRLDPNKLEFNDYSYIVANWISINP